MRAARSTPPAPAQGETGPPYDLTRAHWAAKVLASHGIALTGQVNLHPLDTMCRNEPVHVDHMNTAMPSFVFQAPKTAGRTASPKRCELATPSTNKQIGMQRTRRMDGA